MSDESERRRDLYADVETGIAAEQFCESALGQRLIRDAETERKGLLEQLALRDPDDYGQRASIRRMRHRIGILDCWQEFIAGYIAAGKAAEALLTEGGSEDDEPTE